MQSNTHLHRQLKYKMNITNIRRGYYKLPKLQVPRMGMEQSKWRYNSKRRIEEYDWLKIVSFQQNINLWEPQDTLAIHKKFFLKRQKQTDIYFNIFHSKISTYLDLLNKIQYPKRKVGLQFFSSLSLISLQN